MSKQRVVIGIVALVFIIIILYYGITNYQQNQVNTNMKQANQIAQQMDNYRRQAETYGNSRQYDEAYQAIDNLDSAYAQWKSYYNVALSNAQGDYKQLLVLSGDVCAADVKAEDLYRQELQYLQANDTVDAQATAVSVNEQKEAGNNYKAEYEGFKEDHPGMQAYISENWV